MVKFLLLVSLAAWVGGLWITPFGPVIYDRYWIPFLISGLLFALLIAASTPTYRSDKVTTEGEVAITLSIFFWILVTGLSVLILFTYL